MQPQQNGNNTKSTISLIEKITELDNLNHAFKKVKSNKGAAGVDAKDIEATRLYLKEEGQMITELIREGKYKPKAVRRVDIPKPNGGTRKLVGDRKKESVPSGSHKAIEICWTSLMFFFLISDNKISVNILALAKFL